MGLRYLLVLWEPSGPAAAIAGLAAASEIERAGDWRRVLDRDGCQVWTDPDARSAVTVLAGGQAIAVGRFHDRTGLPAPRLEPSGSGAPEFILAERLLRERWGSYVAVLEPPGGPGRWLMRDPTGALEAFTWRRGPLFVAGSELDRVPRALRPGLHLRWDRVAAQLVTPALFADDLAFDGVSALAPGAVIEVGAEGAAARTVWSPDRILGADRASALAMGRELPDILDACLARMTAPHETLLAEVSGGFDSAVVASALRNTGAASRVAQWVNYYGDRPEGDERAFAAAVAAEVGADLTFVAKQVTPLSEADLTELAAGLRPPVNALDIVRDRDISGRLRDTGATGLVSGQGGDAVFFQMPTALVMADLVAAEGWRRVFSPALLETARWIRRGAWRVAAEALGIGGDRRHGRSGMAFVAPELAAASGALTTPWVVQSGGLAPAKRLQVAALANCRIYRGPSRRGAAAELLYPLLCQPMVETCLAIPSYVLVEGGRDRALARAAFADRIPPAVLARRSKGDLSSFYARTVAASLDMLRPFLLEGVLCGAGLLDRSALEAVLSPDHLIWRAGAGPILTAAMVEAWLRRWQGYAPDAAPRELALKDVLQAHRRS